MKSTHQATRVRFTAVLDQSRHSSESYEQPNSSEFAWVESGWFATIAQQSPDLIGAVSLTGDWLCLNPSGKAILGLTESPLSLSEVLSETMQQFWNQTILAQINECGSWQGQLMLLRSNPIWFESQWFLIRDQYTNQPLGFATISRPIQPPEPTLEQALKRDQHQQRTRFLADAAHDLKTPLAVIATSIDLLNSDRLSSERKQKHFQRIRSKIRQMTQVLDDVLLFSRGEQAEVRVQPIEIDLMQLCAEVIEEAQMNTDQHEIVLSADPVPPSIQTDPVLLQRILANLLSNSVKYSPHGGKIHCRLSVSADQLRVQIQDSGIGIPIAEQSHLFRSFYRASNAGKIVGTGLGLAIVKKCVDRLGGQITVSSAVQIGTCFTVTVPIGSEHRS